MERLKKAVSDLIVVGTDTDVGKSVISLLLMHLLTKRGFSPFYLKPFQTGCSTPFDKNSDAQFISRNICKEVKMDPSDSVLFCYGEPKAPWFAARNQGERPDVSMVENLIKAKRKHHSPLVIEAAGGLMVPIDKKLLIIDLIADIEARSILVARAGLGTINHTLLSIEALESRGIPPLGVVLSDHGSVVPDIMIQENIEAIQSFSNVSVCGVVREVGDFANPSPENLKPLENILMEELFRD